MILCLVMSFLLRKFLLGTAGRCVNDSLHGVAILNYVGVLVESFHNTNQAKTTISRDFDHRFKGGFHYNVAMVLQERSLFFERKCNPYQVPFRCCISTADFKQIRRSLQNLI